eukprot:COSAG02_NODE_7464_length_3000_cov_12.090674_2_plen_428_part_01
MPQCRGVFNEFAPTDETFDLWRYARENPAGLFLCIALLSILFATGIRSVMVEHNIRSVHGFAITFADLSRSAYVVRHQSLHQNGWPMLESLLANLRSRWTCGALLRPIEGDPMNKAQRHFIMIATVVITCAVNILFFDFGDSAKEFCETQEEWGTACTDELADRGRCFCVVYNCDSPGCNNCANCDSIRSCDASCDEVQRYTLGPAILSSLIATPTIFFLNKGFSWWHGPISDAISSISTASKTTAHAQIRVVQLDHEECSDGSVFRRSVDNVAESIHDANDRVVVAERRSMVKAVLPYSFTIVLSLGSLFIIASISRPLNGRATWNWIQSTFLSLAMKWLVIDPVKVVLLTPLHALAQRNQWSQRILKVVNALCLGSTEPRHFRDTVNNVIAMQTKLKRFRLRLMRDQIDAVREQDTATLLRAHEEK